MLTRIHIKDLAIVDTLELELSPGMSVLTGETGAGKSILIDALALTLGDRADNSIIRNGCKRAEITAEFHLEEDSPPLQWLQAQALDEEHSCLLRRVLVRNGNSRGYINGTPVTLKMLQAIGEQLVNIHGQHAHQALLHRQAQGELLDQFSNHQEKLTEIQTVHRRWSKNRERLEQLQAATSERAHRLDLLAFQINELETLSVTANELAQLDVELKRQSNAEKLIQSTQRILQLLNSEETGNILQGLHQVEREMEAIQQLDTGLQESLELIQSAGIQVSEAIHETRQFADNIEIDPERLQQVEERIGAIQDMARKYRCRPEALPDELACLKNEIETLQESDVQLSALEASVNNDWNDYLQLAEALDSSRREAANRLAQAVTETIHSLGMDSGRFQVVVDRLDNTKANRNGLNQISFLVSANPGSEPQPLQKVASGGELSRISLAIQVATIRCQHVPTLIFDEVDVGIGGATAEIVGRLLRQLGESRQTLCVTHLPQVAAQGHYHYQISKGVSGEVTTTSVNLLQADERTQEIARMLGGINLTPQTLAHAREMIAINC